MKLLDALRIDKGDVVAIVGAGGKTSLMWALAKALTKPVCLTTTTKLAYEESLGGLAHLSFAEFEQQSENFPNKKEIILVTNSLDDKKQKWLGLSPSQAGELISACRQKKVTCLIEADGARHLSLKAPARWEPVIPDQVDLVIVVVGLSVIGKPLNAETVFRHEIFSQLTGLHPEEPVQFEHILRMLNHPEGGLKGKPPNCRAAVVFNQTDAYSLTPVELDLAKITLRKNYSTAILTSLRTDPEQCEVIF